MDWLAEFVEVDALAKADMFVEAGMPDSKTAKPEKETRGRISVAGFFGMHQISYGSARQHQIRCDGTNLMVTHDRFWR